MKYFKIEEFACPCCGEAPMQEPFLEKLDELRELYGHPIIITSGYRCKSHNTKVNGRSNSMHLAGRAADITGPDIEALFEAAKTIFMSIGDGRQRKFVHVDDRTDAIRVWKY